jgi:hypothetical protein
VFFLRRAGLVPVCIRPLRLGTWFFGTAQANQDSHTSRSSQEGKSILDSAGNSFSDEYAEHDTPLRLLLLGFAILLQSYFEIPSELIRAVVGLSGAAILSFLGMAASIACICLAVSPRLVTRLHGKIGRMLSRIALIGCLALSLIGCLQVGVIAFRSFQPPFYTNDGTLLDHNAAVLLLEGENPYVSSDIIAALRNFNQLPIYVTPLRQGKLANQQDYPSDEELQQLIAQEPVGHPDQVLEFESHVSYPALAFLVLVPMVWAGLPTVVPFFFLCLALLAVIGLRSVRRELRWWVGLLFLADVPVLNSTMAGDLDVFYILLVFLAWLWWERWWLSAVLMGLALASKQIAWFYFPFYVIFIYQRRGVRDAAKRLIVGALVFFAINLPFVVLNSGAWLAGVLAPVRDPMFPEGVGVIVLSTGKLLPLLPNSVYVVLEGLAMLGAMFWYFRWGRVRPEAAMLLAVLPLFFAWRSLATYFYFCALPAALLLAQAPRRKSQRADEDAATLAATNAKPTRLVLSGEVS